MVLGRGTLSWEMIASEIGAVLKTNNQVPAQLIITDWLNLEYKHYTDQCTSIYVYIDFKTY